MDITQKRHRFSFPQVNFRGPLFTLVWIWLLWAVIVLGFQWVVPLRLTLSRPDNVLQWTGRETERGAQSNKPYLMEPFLNGQVSWDSEYYLSIAVHGYDDPGARTIELPNGDSLSMNYAFFPFYSMVMRAVMVPLSIFGQNPLATATLAGIIVSLLGTLGAMIALYDLTCDELESTGAIRTAFYLLIFPASFFLCQVYTEGLFVGLAFGSLALMRRKQLLWAGVLAALATWTRATGVLLVAPLALTWIKQADWSGMGPGGWDWEPWIKGLPVLLPVVAYLIWSHFLGAQFAAVEENFFSRGILSPRSFQVWADAWASLRTGNNQTIIYYLLEFGAMLLALVSSLFIARRYPTLALFGLLVLLFSAMSGVPQSMIRYMLGVPSIYVFLSRSGRNQVIDRVWTVASVLLMGMLAMLFTFDMWVA